MGLNTAVIVRNDFLHDIKKDDRFGEKLYHAICMAHRDGGRNSSFSVLPSQHADTAQVVVIAANRLRSLGYGSWEHDDEGLLRALADQHGFRLVRKQKAPTP